MRALNKEILRLALPSILANLTVPLVGLVDIAVAGHLDTSAAALIGGISIGSLMFDMMYWNFGFLRAGTGGLTAQAYGREDWRGCLENLRHALTAALLCAFFLLAIQWPFQKLMFIFVQCSDEVRSLALKYFHIRIWAAPATLSLMVLRGWFIGMQDTFSSMLTDVMVNGMNIIASILLALGIPWSSFAGIGFTGIAWGTFIAQYSGLITAACIFLIKYRWILTINHPAGESNEAGRTTMREFFSVNGDLFVRSLCLMGVYLAFSAISARFGDTLLAMCSIMMKLMMIFSYFTDGFAFAGEALTGRFVGRRDKYAVSKTVKWTFIWSMGIGMLFVFLYAAAGTPMFRLMTSDHTVIQAAKAYLPWLVIMPLLGCPAFTWDGIYIGATATKDMRDANIGCLIAFFIIWFGGILISRAAGSQLSLDAKVHLLFAAYYAHLIYRSAYQTLKYKTAILGRA